MPGLGVLTYTLRRWLQNQAEKVDQKSIIKQAHAEAEVTTGYFLVLTISNLIALSGLITNSMPVIIGAMLISPLMGPILNIGFAFMTGDNDVWQKSLRKIALGVGLTLIEVRAALTSDLGIPAELVKTDVLTDRPVKLPAVKVSVLPAGR